MNNMKLKDWRTGALWVSLVVHALVLLAWTYSVLLDTSREESALRRLTDATQREVRQVMGEPIRHFDYISDPGFPIQGNASPKIQGLFRAEAFLPKRGLFYVYYNEEQRVFYWEHVGG